MHRISDVLQNETLEEEAGMANLAKVGGLLPVIQPFAALYVLGPLLTKESERIYELFTRLFKKQNVKKLRSSRQVRGGRLQNRAR